ncbi:MAG TPA: right-handed parallel beta-helix repeat-containing protein [Thermoleophilaceae bacterium]|jgi:hypothetical protein
MRRVLTALFVLAVAALSSGAVAWAHVERTAYWPDPAPDTGVTPAAGGAVPHVRSLSSAMRKSKTSKTRVVCQKGSLKAALKSIAGARKRGYTIRPSQPKVKISKRKAKQFRKMNRAFFKRCKFSEIQPAVTASGNNDRVVIMPGLYTEPTSRAAPTNDPKCEKYKADGDHGGVGVTYAYHFYCPNDQSLIMVLGRALGPGEDPPAQDNRFGIPNTGPCIRCNLQMEGSVPDPNAVIIEGGDPTKTAGPSGVGSKKDVGIRADRADGFVIRRVTLRHSAEHTLYIMETDGYDSEDIKFVYPGQYGSLTFASDHGLTQRCDGIGAGDSAVYPGGAPDTGERRIEKSPRLNQTITRCDLHHNALGYSGTMGNATHVIDNDFYDNATGITTDSFYAGGHPGYPQKSAVFENNRIYSNNRNVYTEGSDVHPDIPLPVGTGLLIAGGNANQVRGNRIWDNWRRGTMLIAVPDQVSDKYDSAESTSHRNRFHDNVFGRTPNGQRKPNGVDMWWDNHPSNEDDCWYHNTGSDGTEDGATSDPPPPILPSDCDNVSSGATYATKSPELGGCAGSILNDQYNADICPWFVTPPPPDGSGQSQQAAASSAQLAAAASVTPFCDLLPGNVLSCAPFRGRRP